MLEWSKMSLSDAGILASVKASDIVACAQSSRECETLGAIPKQTHAGLYA